MKIQPFIHQFSTFFPFSEEEKQLIDERTVMRQVKRKELILEEGYVCKYYSFVLKGCFKMYHIDDKGVKHNLQFASENDWIADIGSFYSEKPSKVYIEAIEPAIILQIEQQKLYYLFTNIPQLAISFKIVIENSFIELQNRLLQTFSSTAQERYLSFLEQYPHLNNRLPNTQIASYLGITPEFLSKIRKDLSRKPPIS